MKKLALLLILGFTFSISSMEHSKQLQESNLQNKRNTIYKLLCKDNQEIEINKTQFNQLQQSSKTIASLITDINEESENNLLPIPDLSKEIMQQILTLIDILSSQDNQYKTSLTRTLAGKSFADIISLFQSADYLDTPSIAELLSSSINNKIAKEVTTKKSIINLNTIKNILTWHQENQVDPQKSLAILFAHQLTQQIPLYGLSIQPNLEQALLLSLWYHANMNNIAFTVSEEFKQAFDQLSPLIKLLGGPRKAALDAAGLKAVFDADQNKFDANLNVITDINTLADVARTSGVDATQISGYVTTNDRDSLILAIETMLSMMNSGVPGETTPVTTNF